MAPFFSIIIPLYNKETYISNTLSNVLKQTFLNFEVIIINDGSTDKSRTKLTPYLKDQRINIYDIPNQGVSHARNFGIKKAKAKYISLLDADDLWDCKYLETIKQLIEIHPEESVFSVGYRIKTPKNTYNSTYSNLPKKQYFKINYFKGSQKESLLNSSSTTLKKTIFDTIGLFDETLKTTEDTDLWIRLGLNYPVVYNKLFLVTVVDTGKGLNSTNRNEYKSFNFFNYVKHRKNNTYFDLFLNKNIYSSMLKYKIVNDMVNFRKLKTILKPKQLTPQKRLLIAMPRSFLLLLIAMNNFFSAKKKVY